MTIRGEIETQGRSRLSRRMRVILFFVVEGAAALLIGFAALFLSFEPGWSAETLQAAFLKPGDARSGSLLLKTEDGYADASRLGIDVDLTVSGPTVRARVTQIFRNPTQNWVEATYVYPLPSGGAVDTLKMVGTLKLGGHMYGLVQTKDGLVHRVSDGNYMGQADGKITDIAPAKITLTEIVPDGLGGYMERPAALGLNE